MREHTEHFYRGLYAEQFCWQQKLDDFSFLSIDADERNWLEREEKEVWEVVRDLNADKALGPNGFGCGGRWLPG
jgi:hypothetical protein